MILETLVAASLIMQAPAQVVCPIMGSAIKASSPFDDYAGVRFTYCCPGCDSKFANNPLSSIREMRAKNRIGGQSLFDPTTGLRLDITKARFSSDYKGVRFYFANENGKKTFDASPAKFGELPTKEVLTCPVMKSPIENYSKAFGYVDHEGVRYYICCGGCINPMKENPAKFAADVADKVAEPKVFPGKPAAAGGSRNARP